MTVEQTGNPFTLEDGFIKCKDFIVKPGLVSSAWETSEQTVYVQTVGGIGCLHTKATLEQFNEVLRAANREGLCASSTK